MQILALNSSPRGKEESKTELVLQKFLEGARQAGAAAETRYLRNYRVKHCLGCFACWFETPGRCVQKDDMTGELYDLFLVADVVVLASPLYHYNLNARMKAFIERTLPMIRPDFVDRGAKTGHPLRVGNAPRIVALSVCAFPEAENFKALSLNLKMIFGQNLVAEIYRHSSEFMGIPELAPQVAEVLAAMGRAGEELVRLGRVEPDTQAALGRDLAPRDMIIQAANQEFAQIEMRRSNPSPTEQK
jgi:multimeric flavodoxin WrbA